MPVSRTQDRCVSGHDTHCPQYPQVMVMSLISQSPGSSGRLRASRPRHPAGYPPVWCHYWPSAQIIGRKHVVHAAVAVTGAAS
jgi:hypothetical protein